jgi:hypothetical protein
VDFQKTYFKHSLIHQVRDALYRLRLLHVVLGAFSLMYLLKVEPWTHKLITSQNGEICTKTLDLCAQCRIFWKSLLR